jgi:hypothetical protein
MKYFSNEEELLVYTKNLEQLIQFLQVSRQQGLLTVEPVEPEVVYWQGQMHLVEGNVVACRVIKKADRQVLLINDEARRWLSTQGKLNWQLEATQQADLSSSSQPLRQSRISARQNHSGPLERIGATPIQPGWIPQRTGKGMLTPAQSLDSLESLQVFTLVNGQNTVEGIARILRKPIQVITPTLERLRRAGLIT